ncbi:GGDEF domain-containing protein [Amphritea balenae]|uniref:diguanylate cyclase n=1 Tax=Amphritea balenae TaxID=452629 RepID=A0A3P1SM93_9GAMM|nr:GGDEF domain-containing protein [Amphritea balenae]RRC98069.1 GGDEF domain-containing protein [Amphritea balenae]GGK67301.1 hypothetical protein GCM10007941_16750 [Amphritea balenae]
MKYGLAELDQLEHPDSFEFHKRQILPVFQPLLLFGAAINIIFGISFLYTHPETGQLALVLMALAAFLILCISYYITRCSSDKHFTLIVCGFGVVSILLTIFFFIITPKMIVFTPFTLFYFLFAALIIAPLLNLKQLVPILVILTLSVCFLLIAYSDEGLNLIITYVIYLSGLLIFVYVSIYKVHQNGQMSFELSSNLHKRSMTDELTTVFNRRAWYMATRDVLGKNDPRALPLTVMLLDIDFFKDINGSYGQIAGDRVLVRFVELISAHLREKDLIGRLSSDQFILLMPSLSLAVAETKAEQIRSQIQLNSVTHMGKPVNITCSIGLVSFRSYVNDISSLIQAADYELIEAKRKGRNCICAVEY